MPGVLPRGQIVSNTSPLTALHGISQLPPLQSIFGTVLVPPAVEVECMLPAPWPSFLRRQALSKAVPRQVAAAGLGPGETEALGLALEINAGLLLLDDRAARRLALSMGVPVMGTLGVIFRAKQKGLVPVVRPLLDDLKEQGFRVGQRLCDMVLRDAGEM